MPTNRERFFKLHGIPKTESLSLQEIGKYSKIPTRALQEVADRGLGAARTNLASVRLKSDFSKNPDTAKYPASARLTQQQWSVARVYAFVMKTKKVYYGADNDIRLKYHLE